MDGKERKRRGKSSQNQGEGEGPRTGRETIKQDEALPDETRLREALRRNRFCQGVKCGKEYRCGGDAGEDVKSKAVELLVEAVRRMQRWRVWDPWWVEEVMDEWLMARDRLEVQLRGKYDDEVVNAVTGLFDEFINYSERFWNYWREVGSEAKKLLEDLLNGRSEVIVRLSGISVYHEHITLKVNKMSTGITVQLVLNGLEGVTIRVPDVFRKTMSEEEYKRFVRKVLRALRGGFEETDGYVDKGYAAMGTTQIWQVIVWALLYFGRMYVYIDAVNVNEGDVTITWHLRSSHKPLKGKILSNTDKLSEEELLAFMLTAVLGDGGARIAKRSDGSDIAVIKITMSGEKFDRWEPLLSRLWDRFRWHKYPNNPNTDDVNVTFFSGYAIDLSRAMIAVLPPILRDVLDALAFEKWSNLRRIAEMELKFRIGESQVIVANYGFTVNAHKGTVVLMRWTKDDIETKKVIDALKALYGNELHARVSSYGKRRAVIIPMYVFEKYDNIRRQVIEVLCRKLEKVKDERKRQEIIKLLMRLTPTEGAAAVDHQQNLKTPTCV